MAVTSYQMSLDEIQREVATDGHTVYLHKEVPVHRTGGAMLKANTNLTVAVLNAIQRVHGGELVLTVGYEPIGEENDKLPAGLGPIRMIREFVREDARKRNGAIFIDKGSLVMAAREAEELLAVPPVTKLDTWFVERMKPLAQVKDRAILGTMLNRALADSMAALYLDEITPATTQREDESKQESRVASIVMTAMLKDVSLCVDVEYCGTAARETVHPALSAYWLLGKHAAANDEALRPDALRDRTQPIEIANALRTILEHESPLSKSRLGQVVMRGMALCDWLLGAPAGAASLQKEQLQNASHMTALELGHYLYLGSLCAGDPAVAEAMQLQAAGNPALRLVLFDRYLAGQGSTRPFANPAQLRSAFREFFRQFPDYDETAFEFIYYSAVYQDELLRQHKTPSEVKTATAAYADRMRNLLF